MGGGIVDSYAISAGNDGLGKKWALGIWCGSLRAGVCVRRDEAQFHASPETRNCDPFPLCSSWVLTSRPRVEELPLRMKRNGECSDSETPHLDVILCRDLHGSRSRSKTPLGANRQPALSNYRSIRRAADS
jgi:hypothetical protein